jgi:nucleotide-binding universal stress UspA family protein
MQLKDILLHADSARGQEARLALAVELAGRHGAHLSGLFVIEPMSFVGFATPGGTDFSPSQAVEMIGEQYIAARRAVGDRLGAEFEAATERAGIVGEWRVVEGDAPSETTSHARYADLAILGQSDPEQPPFGEAIAEAVLVGSGRPVLVVPYIGTSETIGRRVLVAWNATREAARAVNDALPLFADAARVTLLSINPARGTTGEGDLPAADIALHLARHGVEAEAAQLTAEEVTVGDLILSRAADLGADLIVMGGYGQSRAREYVFGGVTRTLLRHMTVPVLLSH